MQLQMTLWPVSVDNCFVLMLGEGFEVPNTHNPSKVSLVIDIVGLSLEKGSYRIGYMKTQDISSSFSKCMQ